MRVQLTAHPDTPAGPVRSIAVEIGRTGSRGLRVRYAIDGNMRQIRMPRATPGIRTDGLWQHSCFEMFIQTGAGPEYLEFNFAPSKAWAAYRFDAYRAGMAEFRVASPHIALDRDIAPSALEAVIQLDSSVSVDRPWRIGLSAVIEERNGRKSYWALAHPQGKPDFHDPACFVLELPASG